MGASESVSALSTLAAQGIDVEGKKEVKDFTKDEVAELKRYLADSDKAQTEALGKIEEYER